MKKIKIVAFVGENPTCQSTDLGKVSSVCHRIKDIPGLEVEVLSGFLYADLVVTTNTTCSLEQLKNGKKVLQIPNFLTLWKGDSLEEKPYDKSSIEEIALGLKKNYSDSFILSEPEIWKDEEFDSKIISYFEKLDLFNEEDPEQKEIVEACEFTGKTILMVDDYARSRNVFMKQFGEKNFFTRTSGYGKALWTLKEMNPGFDTLFTDMMMPTEHRRLSCNVAESQLGEPIPAGMFLVSAAIACGIKDIVLFSWGDHHQDSCTALLRDLSESYDMGSYRVGETFVSINPSHNKSINGGKNWADAYRKHLELRASSL